MRTKQPLRGLRVLVTRSIEQAPELIARIHAYGGHVEHVPMVSIEPLPTPAVDKATIDALKIVDDIIFISANAVTHGLAVLEAYEQTLPKQARLFAVGQKTQQTLHLAGCKPVIVPQVEYSSEGLLALDELQHVSDRQVLIVRGRGGNERLKQVLQQRGAKVLYLECYERKTPPVDSLALNDLFDTQQVDVLCCSSLQTLENVLSMVTSPQLFNCQLVSISKRMTQTAKDKGFKNPIIEAKSATDDAILESLIQLNEQTL